MNPAADVIAAGAPRDIDLSKLRPGQPIVVLWRGSPILVVNRTPEALRTLQQPSLIARLSDRNSSVTQQPSYADNKPYRPGSGLAWPIFLSMPWLEIRSGRRVYTGVPAPYNLPVPPYHLPSEHVLRIGENPTGTSFALSSVVQM
jgi:ubiquinol-cytochrome c reductase iron-sulfur subunit